MNLFYTYAFLREDKTPYYIGKGCNERIWKRDGRPCKHPKDKSKVIYLKQNLTEEEAFRHEVYMIALYGRKDLGEGILHNRTNGGDGSSGRILSEESITKMSVSQKGKKMSPEAIAKTAAANRGRKHSQESRDKMSEAQKGRIISQEHRDKLSDALTGKSRSQEVCNKISNTMKGKPKSPETRAKMSASKTGKKLSPEHRAKISDTKRRKNNTESTGVPVRRPSTTP